MASLTHLKKRLGGIRSINQITAAMELVAATKMRKAQEVALSTRPYAWSALELLGNIVRSLEAHKPEEVMKSPLLAKREMKKTAVLVVTSDKGLVGSFNSSVLRRLEKFLKQRKNGNLDDLLFVAVGQKGADFIKKKGGTLVKTFTNYGDIVNLGEVEELSSLLVEGYLRREWDSAIVFSANFVSALRQEAVMRELLPMDFQKLRQIVQEVIPETGRYSDLKSKILGNGNGRPENYLIEPSPRGALERLLPHLFTVQIYHVMLEANASEHSARRVAMKNASDNAGELITALTLRYNRSRQELITKELTEITSTVAALNPTGK